MCVFCFFFRVFVSVFFCDFVLGVRPMVHVLGTPVAPAGRLEADPSQCHNRSVLFFAGRVLVERRALSTALKMPNT